MVSCATDLFFVQIHRNYCVTSHQPPKKQKEDEMKICQYQLSGGLPMEMKQPGPISQIILKSLITHIGALANYRKYLRKYLR